MLIRQTLIALAVAGVSATAFADSNKTDLFGRPYVNETNTQVYYEANPYAPLPQFQAIHQAERREVQAAVAQARVQSVSPQAGVQGVSSQAHNDVR